MATRLMGTAALRRSASCRSGRLGRVRLLGRRLDEAAHGEGDGGLRVCVDASGRRLREDDPILLDEIRVGAHDAHAEPFRPQRGPGGGEVETLDVGYRYLRRASRHREHDRRPGPLERSARGILRDDGVLRPLGVLEDRRAGDEAGVLDRSDRSVERLADHGRHGHLFDPARDVDAHGLAFDEPRARAGTLSGHGPGLLLGVDLGDAHVQVRCGQRGHRLVAGLAADVGHGRLCPTARDEDDDGRLLVHSGALRRVLIEDAPDFDVLIGTLAHLRGESRLADLLHGKRLELSLHEGHGDEIRACDLVGDPVVDVVRREAGGDHEQGCQQPGPERAATNGAVVVVVPVGGAPVCRWRLGAAEDCRRGGGDAGSRQHRSRCVLRRRRDREPLREAGEVRVHVARAAVSLLRVLRQRTQDDRVELVRDLGPLRRGRLGNRGEVLHRDLERRIPTERDAAREHLVEHDPGGVEIRGRPGRETARLLGRQVLGGADDRACFRHLARAGAGDSEVHDLDAAVGRDDDVVRLDVAVDDAVAVRVVERGEDLARVVDGDPDRRRAA